ncbi:MAG TPA: glycosyltransferase [Candidatus Bathyarchaeia archaeon]
MPINLLVLTSIFVMDPKDITEGIGTRYGGLYSALAKDLLNISPQSKVFWYSNADQTLRIITKNKMSKSSCGMFKAVLESILTSLKERSYLVGIVTYPTILQASISRIAFRYASSLLALRILSPTRTRLIVDIIDPPVPAAYAHSETEPSKFTRIAWRMLDILSLKLASLVLVLTQSYKQYIAKSQWAKKSKIRKVPAGTLVKFINNTPPKSKGPLTLLYAGSARRVKDVDKLVFAVDNLRKKGLQVNLNIAGARLMDLPDWVQNKQSSWPQFVNTILSEADVGVIPYPPNRLHFSYTMPSKLSDYMAAGKPVISTNCKEPARIINTFKCGLVAKDWKEFELHIEKLYYDRELAKKLGENGRKAAERYFDNELLAKKLLKNLPKMFAVKHQ